MRVKCWFRCHPDPSKNGDVVAGRSRNKWLWPRLGYTCERALLVRLCDVQGPGTLWLCCAAVKVGKAECIPVKIEFAAGVRVV